MIVRLSDDIMDAMFGARSSPRMAHHPSEFPKKNPAQDVIGLVPEWLSDMAAGGNLLVISDDEYDGLPFELRGFVEVVRR